MDSIAFDGPVDAVRFCATRSLGLGAEGGAWCAEDQRRGGRPVVLKRVEPGRRFRVERAFQMLRRVSSPHLPAVLELLEEPDGGGWLISEYLEGAPLCAGPAPLPEALADVLGVGHALAAMHACGTHHGDVSANNVIRVPDGAVVLTDFGQVGERGCGSPGFLAPEVLAGGGGPDADRFALGCLFAWRLFGAVPWHDPAAVARLGGHGDVRQRVGELASDAGVRLPGAILELFVALLHPDPACRESDPRRLVARLQQLGDAARQGTDLEACTRWWPPRRWPYHGVCVRSLAATLAGERPPRLIAVAGPRGSGRRRLIEEVVHSLQQQRHGFAKLCDAAHVGVMLGMPAASWLLAWMEGGAETPPQVIGVVGELVWPDAATQDLSLRVAMLRSGAQWSRSILVVAVSMEDAEQLRRVGPTVRVVDVLPWTREDVAIVLQPVLDSPDFEAWVDLTYALSGGWPARVVRVVEACARRRLERPDAALVREAFHAEELGLPPAQALAVVRSTWGADDDLIDLPPHLLSADGRPFDAVVQEARRAMGKGSVVDLARAEVEARRQSGRALSLELVIDTERPELVAKHLIDLDPLPPLALAWLLAGGAKEVEEGVRLTAARAYRAQGRPQDALSLTRNVVGSPAVHHESARALSDLGRQDEALAELACVSSSATCEDLSLRARGLRWRILADLGRAEVALDEAVEWWGAGLHRVGIGAATACLWAGFAANQAGQGGAADAWLDRASRALPEGEAWAREASSVRARLLQVRASHAYVRGQNHLAARSYREAVVAFEVAGEPVGGMLAEGCLVAVAVSACGFDEGAQRGRASLRALIASVQINALPGALLNLVLCLCRLDQLDEAERWVETVGQLVAASGDASPVGRARLARTKLELECAHARAGAVEGTTLTANAPSYLRFRDVALCCEGANLPSEAAETWLRAAAGARASGDLQHARSASDRACELAEALDDPAIRHRVALDRLVLAGSDRDAPSRRACAMIVASLPAPAALRARGQLDLAWTHDCYLLLANHGSSPARVRARRAIWRRARKTMENIVDNVTRIDRGPVRASLVAELEGVDPVASLAPSEEGEHVRGADVAPVGAPGQAAAAAPNRAERLLRMYGRFAREEDIELLLDQVVEAMMELTDAERAVVVVGEGKDRVEVAREVDRQADAIKISRSILEKVVQTGDAVLSVDAAEDARFGDSRSVSHLNLRSVLAVPLVYRGQVLGAAYVDHRLRRGAFGDDDLGYLEDFANLAALAVAHTRALGAVRAQASALEKQQEVLASLLAEREAEVSDLRSEVRRSGEVRAQYRGMIGGSDAMQRVFALIDRLGDSTVAVVIYGESGTGKELVARGIHDAGSRRDRPFVAENCGAVPDTLLESILFGHARGAFTGADRARVGLFEAAQGGTIFLDEIGEMSAAMQTSLLRVLQDGEVRRIGETKSRRVDVRVIAASNRRLETLVRDGKFRNDLYYRVQVVKVDLPNLRDRRTDISQLIGHFLSRYGGEHLTVTAHAKRLLCSYGWPGNVRELENEVQRWVVLAEDKVRPEDLSPAILEALEGRSEDPDDLRLRVRVDRLERRLLARALERTQGNQTKAAALLGLSRFGLQKKLRRLDRVDAESVGESASASTADLEHAPQSSILLTSGRERP
ncbi:MAG: sigma 54-interacting transcriptional regulator [Nannocystaceae bacterium]